VEEFILTIPTPAQQPWPRAETQARVLRNLDVEDTFALDLAESVLALEERDEDVEEAAFALLGRSRDPERRSVIFEHTDDLPAEERISPLTKLSPPLYDAEEDRLVELLDEALPTLAAVGVDQEDRNLAGKLSAGGWRRFCAAKRSRVVLSSCSPVTSSSPACGPRSSSTYCPPIYPRLSPNS
jgi:hypothetical protein